MRNVNNAFNKSLSHQATLQILDISRLEKSAHILKLMSAIRKGQCFMLRLLYRRSAKMVRTNDLEVVWDMPNPVDEKWIEFIDDNVLRSALPSCTHVVVPCFLIVLRAPRR